MNKSRAEVEDLKRRWAEDPSFDLEDTPGFESYRAELATFAETAKARWKEQEEQRVATRAAELECSPRTLLFIEGLEREIKTLAQSVESLRDELQGSPRP